MALFLIERNYAEQLGEITEAGIVQTGEVNEELGLDWLFSFMTADRKKTYCLYEASNVELIREQAKCLGLPTDVIVEVSQLSPTMFERA